MRPQLPFRHSRACDGRHRATAWRCRTCARYGATFLIFSDYMQPADAALPRSSEIAEHLDLTRTTRSASGEDGPTHQPVEQLMTLARHRRACSLLRPCDANEVPKPGASRWSEESAGRALALTRQEVPTLDRKKYNPADGCGAAPMFSPIRRRTRPEVILIGTGSEVQLCSQAQRTLAKDGIGARVVSHAVLGIVRAQDEAYRDSRAAAEDHSARVGGSRRRRLGWDRYVGLTGAMIGMHSFGASGPCMERVQEVRHYGRRGGESGAARRWQRREEHKSR